MLNLRALAAGALFLSAPCLPLAAQDLGNSPYSRYGLGEQTPVGFLRNSGMAGVGLSSPGVFQINEINPALLHYNRQVTFELAAGSQLKEIENETTSQQTGNAGLRYLAFAFPVMERWTTSIGLKPFSNVSYQVATHGPIAGDDSVSARYLYQGRGGITEIYFANGVSLGKGLSLGLQASYLFGSITNEAATQLLSHTDMPMGNLVVYTDRKTLNDIALKAGLAYRTSIAENLNLGIGATYQHLFAFSAKQLRTISTVSPITSLTLDTLAPTITERRLQVPAPMQLGFSIDRPNRWMLALDFHTQDWSRFTALNESESTMQRSYRVGLGGEFVPDPNSVTNYLKRITYRAGVAYGRSPIVLNGREINEQQASFGLSLPTGRAGSVVNLSFIAGTRGTTDFGLIKETYYRFELGVSLNERWFHQRRID